MKNIVLAVLLAFVFAALVISTVDSLHKYARPGTTPLLVYDDSTAPKPPPRPEPTTPPSGHAHSGG